MSTLPQPAPVSAALRPAEERVRTGRAVARYLGVLVLDDRLADRAAILTFYAVLAALPLLTTLLAVAGTLHASVIDPVLDEVRALGPGVGVELVTEILNELRDSAVSAPLVLVGLPVTLAVLGRYVGALVHAIRDLYGIGAEKPTLRTLLVRTGVIAVAVPLLGLCLIAVVTTGELAAALSSRAGFGTAWTLLKWPVVLAITATAVVLLYRIVLHGHGTRYRRLARGSLLAIGLWLAASAGFALYVNNVGSYGRYYGSLAGAIVLLTWVWMTHFALLLGAAFNAPDPRAAREVPMLRYRDPAA